MAIEQRFNRVWNGMSWVDIHNPTNANLVDVGEGKTLAVKLNEIKAEHEAHANDTSVHITQEERNKVANLAEDANGTYATKVQLAEHEADDNRHIDDALALKLSNLADDANATYATKTQVAGIRQTFFYASYAERDADDVSNEPDGTLCWVAAETTPGSSGRATKYMLEGGEWRFLFEADANMIVNWSDIEDAPDLTAAELEKVYQLMHTHENMSVLNALDKDSDGHLTLDGVIVGEKFNRVYLDHSAPTNPNVGDIWLKPIV